MINQIRVQNFKCLADVTVDLGPFTVFIGPNDSGKTSLLDAIHMLGRTTRESPRKMFQESDSAENLVWYHQTDRVMGWHVSGRIWENDFHYSLGIPANGSPPIESIESRIIKMEPDQTQQFELNANVRVHVSNLGNLRIGSSWDGTALSQLVQRDGLYQAFANAFSSSEKFRLAAETMHRPSQVKPRPELAPNGSNLAAVLDALISGPDRLARTNIEKYLHDVVPTLAGIALQVVGQNEKTIEFALANGGPPFQTIPAALASDGALLLTAYLALAYGPTPEILLIEEPENGLHPSRLKQVIELFRKMSRGEVGNRPRQIIMATHSPILLNYVEPDEVRIFQRDPEKGTQITPMNKVPNIDKFINDFATGELWYLLGEEKLVQGVAG
jgi:predicted ATPase